MNLLQLRHRYMRRRLVERLLRKLGMSRRRAVQIANRFF